MPSTMKDIAGQVAAMIDDATERAASLKDGIAALRAGLVDASGKLAELRQAILDADEPPVPTPTPTDRWGFVDVLPASLFKGVEDSSIEIWNIPTSGGFAPQGNPSKFLLMVPPKDEIVGPVRFVDQAWRGSAMIGPRLRVRAGSQLSSPTDKVWGGNILQHSAVTGLGFAPELFIGKVDVDSRNPDRSSEWGDFLRFGTKPNKAKDNYAEWTRLYLQDIYCPFGHWGFSEKEGTKNVAHADFVQAANGGFIDAYLARCYLAWNYQTLFLKGADVCDNRCAPDGRLFLTDIYLTDLPPNPRIYGPTGQRRIVFLTNVGKPMNKSPTDAESGNYYAAIMKGVFADPRNSNNANDLASYWTPAGVPGGKVRTTKGVVEFPLWTAPGRKFPLWSDGAGGKATVVIGLPPKPVITPDKVGLDFRVTNAAELRAAMRAA